MSQITQTKCDACGRVKQETNHWFHAWVTSTGIAIQRNSKPDEVHINTHRDLCGEACAHKLLDQFLTGGSRGVIPLDSDRTGNVMASASREKTNEKEIPHPV